MYMFIKLHDWHIPRGSMFIMNFALRRWW